MTKQEKSSNGKEKAKKIDALRAQGKSSEAACKEVGLSTSMYYYYRDSLNKENSNSKSKVKTIIYDAGKVKAKKYAKTKIINEDMFLVFGNVEQVASFYKNLKG